MRIGQLFALGLIILTLTPYFGLQSPSTVFMAVVIFWGATYEGRTIVRWGDLHQRCVAHIAFTRTITPVLPEQSLHEIMERVLKMPHLDLPVIGTVGLIGILRRDDILRALQHGQTQALVSSVMRTDYPTISTSDSLQTVRHHMARTQFTTLTSSRPLPVFEGQALVGLINVRDVNEAMYTSQ